MFMKCKVHWLIDGLVEIEADNIDNAEKIIKDKIEAFIKSNSDFFEIWPSIIRRLIVIASPIGKSK